ncbi:hypothetical protein CLV40_1085 [Actinokineospora auranticolor]|uniref:Uncharacterized protein n=2 Tax=Actinokineospora auranticolor TaxID=155976 RepID=A0A2S6GP60_9PSEU|nr:hypothetical protein CLV40_1085 [Actinokineospora auranticolor]
MIVGMLALYAALCVGHPHPTPFGAGHMVATEVLSGQQDPGTGEDGCGNLVHDPDALNAESTHPLAVLAGGLPLADTSTRPTANRRRSADDLARPPPWGRALLTRVCVART